MNYDVINKLFDEGANIDEIIDAARKINTQREAEANAAKQDLIDARQEVIDATKIYLLLAFDAAGVETTEYDDKIDKAAEDMADTLDDLVQSVKGMYSLLDRLKDLRDKLEADEDENDTEKSDSEDSSDNDEDGDVLTRFINYLRSR